MNTVTAWYYIVRIRKDVIAGQICLV